MIMCNLTVNKVSENLNLTTVFHAASFLAWKVETFFISNSESARFRIVFEEDLVRAQYFGRENFVEQFLSLLFSSNH